jgi:DnaJ domain
VDAQTSGVDPVRRSYAVLGLEAGASLAEVRRRYRFLASRWHPDRYVGDQRNEAEAGAQMRRINDAYHLIVAKRASEDPHSATVSPVGRRLSPDEVDALAKAIGNEGPNRLASRHRWLDGEQVRRDLWRTFRRWPGCSGNAGSVAA